MADQIKQIFNIYCDESRVENKDSSRMVIGSLLLPRINKQEVVNGLEILLQKQRFLYEIKWTKTSSRFINLYKEIVDYFILRKDLEYRCIIVNKEKVDYAQYHNDDKELAFFKFYYLMLRQKVIDFKNYYIFLDRKPTRDKNRARALHAYLESHILLHKQECSIKHFQAYGSKDNLLLQLVDYLTGIVSFQVNTKDGGGAKQEMAEYLLGKLGRDSFLQTSPLWEEKFNCFVWIGDEKER